MPQKWTGDVLNKNVKRAKVKGFAKKNQSLRISSCAEKVTVKVMENIN